MIYCFDIDGTICTLMENSQYEKAVPYKDVIDRLNSLYDSGNTIKIMTARGCSSGIDHTELTKRQLDDWGVKHHELIMHKKPNADLFIDDKGISVDRWMAGYSNLPGFKNTRGILAGSFDIIHNGYIDMFKVAKKFCTHLTVALHEDPTLENPSKPTVIQSLKDRKEILESIRYVDSVVSYKTEKSFETLLRSGEFDVRFLGDDYYGKEYTAKDLDLKIVWVSRTHGKSTTSLKSKIAKSMSAYNEN